MKRHDLTPNPACLSGPGPATRTSRSRGFTVAEVVIVVVLTGIVLSIALPGFKTVSRRVQIDTAAQQLVGDFYRARVEAVKRNRTVYVARSSATGYAVEFIGSRTLPSDVVIGSGPDTVRFAPFGPTLTGPATYVLALGDVQRTVHLNAAGTASAR